MAQFISRKEKAEWGIPCNQSADGKLWVGKGYEKTLEGQFGTQIAIGIKNALNITRGDRGGRFWIDLETKAITMMVGASEANTYEQVNI